MGNEDRPDPPFHRDFRIAALDDPAHRGGLWRWSNLDDVGSLMLNVRCAG